MFVSSEKSGINVAKTGGKEERKRKETASNWALWVFSVAFVDFVFLPFSESVPVFDTALCRCWTNLKRSKAFDWTGDECSNPGNGEP